MQSTPDPSRDPFPNIPSQESQNKAASFTQMQEGLRGPQLIQAYNAAGSSFYSIAIFSLINSIVNYFEGSVYFPIGLGITQIIDAFSIAFQQSIPEAHTFILIVGLILNLLIFAVVAFFGFFVKKQYTWPILVGSALYLLDGVLILFFQDWIGAAFHAYFLFRLWTSWQAIRNLSQPVVSQGTIGSL